MLKALLNHFLVNFLFLIEMYTKCSAPILPPESIVFCLVSGYPSQCKYHQWPDGSWTLLLWWNIDNYDNIWEDNIRHYCDKNHLEDRTKSIILIIGVSRVLRPDVSVNRGFNLQQGIFRDMTVAGYWIKPSDIFEIRFV